MRQYQEPMLSGGGPLPQDDFVLTIENQPNGCLPGIFVLRGLSTRVWLAALSLKLTGHSPPPVRGARQRLRLNGGPQTRRAPAHLGEEPRVP